MTALKMKLEDLKQLLRNCGVVGAGGAGFPTYAKLSDGADTVILNCAECEPLLKLHRQVIEEHTFEILSAFDGIVKAIGAQRGIIAIKAHYTSALRAIEAEISEFPFLTVHKLRSVYPSGDELILIKEVTGKTVRPGDLPITEGVIVCNAETVYNVYRAERGNAVTEKYVTVAGEVATPITLRVPIGTSFADLVKAAGGVTAKNMAYISGGPMMGKEVSLSDVVTRTTNALLVLPETHNVVLNKRRNAKTNLLRTMSVCCQCHSCTDLCSRHNLGYPVEPHMVMRVLSNGGKGDIARIAGSLFCSGCGLCETYSCPQDLSPKVMIDQLKTAARESGYKPSDEIRSVSDVKDSEYKQVSLQRLTVRLGLKKYDISAPLDDDLLDVKKVKILLSQHIGAPSEPCVSLGDTVKKGDVIAKAKDNALGVNIHASIDGKISAITSKYIKIN